MVPASRHGRYRAELADGTALCLSRQPFLDAARALISAGFKPSSVLIGWRRGSAAWALRATLKEAAKLTVDETKTCFARWKAFSSSAVGAQKRYSEGEAIPLPESPNASLRDQDGLAGRVGYKTLAPGSSVSAGLLGRASDITSAKVAPTTTISVSSSSSKSPPFVVDPPPKRRSPRTASARANSTSDNAAASSNYTEETSTSSRTRTRGYLRNGSARAR